MIWVKGRLWGIINFQANLQTFGGMLSPSMLRVNNQRENRGWQKVLGGVLQFVWWVTKKKKKTQCQVTASTEDIVYLSIYLEHFPASQMQFYPRCSFCLTNEIILVVSWCIRVERKVPKLTKILKMEYDNKMSLDKLFYLWTFYSLLICIYLTPPL